MRLQSADDIDFSHNY